MGNSRRGPRGRQRHPELASTLSVGEYLVGGPGGPPIKAKIMPVDIEAAQQGNADAQKRVVVAYKAAIFAARGKGVEATYAQINIIRRVA